MKNMKKILMILMIAFTMVTGLFADVKLVPKDTFNNCIVPFFDVTAVQPLIAYAADTWEDVYEKTGVDKYGWIEGNSIYCDCKYQYCLIIKCIVVENGGLWWMCLEFPGDGSENKYIAEVD